jgi:hypothetical protein
MEAEAPRNPDSFNEPLRQPVLEEHLADRFGFDHQAQC